MNRRGRLFTLLVIAMFLVGAAAVADSQDAAERDILAALEAGGNVVLMRHAVAPGDGDPPGFRLDDCSTQRNLSEVDRVLTSRWCRCRETAELLDLAPVEEYPVLNFGIRWLRSQDIRPRSAGPRWRFAW
ncbi:MAG: hypothetical protein JXB06_09870 [Spirochaetales bacterium]|nr:hypothetical protein [Spirochaetales bacterium]